jgi:hypothetical protein
MTMTTESTELAAERQDNTQPSYFEAKPVPGRALFNKGPAKFEVTPNDGHGDVTVGDVTVYGTGMGVHVERPEEPAEGQQPDLSVRISADCQTASAYNATLKQTDNDGPVSVITAGTVTLVNAAAEAPAAAENAETGLQLNIGADGVTGKLDGMAFDINPSGNDIAVDANRLGVKPGAEVSTDETDIKLSLSKEFNRVVLEGLHVKVMIELDKKGQAFVYATGGVASVIAPNAETGPALEANGDLIRLTLKGGRVFDINTANGEVTGYVPDKDTGIQNEDPLELAEKAPEENADDYQITISQDNKRVALNGAGLEKTAEGALVTATDGIAGFKPPVPVKTGPDLGEKVADADGLWVYLGEVKGKPLFVAMEDSGRMRFGKAMRFAKKHSNSLPSDDEMFRMFNERSSLSGLDEKGMSSKAGLYLTAERGNVHDFKYGQVYHGSIFRKHSVRVVRHDLKP